MIDLHIHTTCSDGTDSAAMILDQAEDKGVRLLSITDHNSIKAYDSIKDDSSRRKFSGEIIPGVELSTIMYGEIAEILGYGIDIDTIREFTEKNYIDNSKLRTVILKRTLDKYAKIGCKVDIDINKFDPDTMPVIHIIYASLIQYESNKKFFTDTENFYDYSKYMRLERNNPESPLFIDLTDLYPKPEYVFDVIKKAGGLSFVAHVFMYSHMVYDRLDDIIKTYKPDGFECYYSKFTKEQTKNLKSFCLKNDLLISGGSDYHGSNRPEIKMVTGLGDLKVDENDIRKWSGGVLKI